jgi:lipid II:glycine glycyltransferase (peptidoglycan interpeptide bridge formation enzyme)
MFYFNIWINLMITPIDKTDDEIIQNFERRNRSKVRLALKRGTKVACNES